MSAISLKKKEPISLSKVTPGLSKATVGVGWDPIDSGKKRGFFSSLFGGGDDKDIDLDASIATFSDDNTLVEVVSFQNLKSKDGFSIIHSGDDRTGRNSNYDNETISLDLAGCLATGATKIVVTVNSFQGHTFDSISNCHARLLDGGKDGKPIVQYDLNEQGRHTGVVMFKLTHSESTGWTAEAIGEPTQGSTIREIMSDVKRHLN